MPVGLHRTAATITAVTNRVKPTEHRVFKERVMDMPTFVLRTQNLHCLVGSDPVRSRRMMFKHEASKGLSDDQTDIEGKARRLTRSPARAFHNDDVVGIGEDDVLGESIGDDALKVPDVNVAVDCEELRRRFKRDNLAVVGICEADSRSIAVSPARKAGSFHESLKPIGQPSKTLGKGMFADGEADVEIGPAKINVRVEFVEP